MAGVGSLDFSGAPDRFPDLTLTLSPGGSYFLGQSGRFDRIDRDHETPTVPSQLP
jgi:hypothetical protein